MTKIIKEIILHDLMYDREFRVHMMVLPGGLARGVANVRMADMIQERGRELHCHAVMTASTEDIIKRMNRIFTKHRLMPRLVKGETFTTVLTDG